MPTSPFGSLFVFENMPKPAMDPRLPFQCRVMDIVSGSNHQTVLCLFPEAERLAISLFYDSHEIARENIVELGRRFLIIALAIANLRPTATSALRTGLSRLRKHDMWLAVDGKIKYRAIVSDLDGTLLDPSGNLSDVTVETLNILQRRGWKSSLQRALRRGCAGSWMGWGSRR